MLQTESDTRAAALAKVYRRGVLLCGVFSVLFLLIRILGDVPLSRLFNPNFGLPWRIRAWGSILNELILFLCCLLVLAVGMILSPMRRWGAERAEAFWRRGGLVCLASVVVGYFLTLPFGRNLTSAETLPTSFCMALTLYLFPSLGGLGLPLNPHAVTLPPRAYALRVLGRCGILVAVLVGGALLTEGVGALWATTSVGALGLGLASRTGVYLSAILSLAVGYLLLSWLGKATWDRRRNEAGDPASPRLLGGGLRLLLIAVLCVSLLSVAMNWLAMYFMDLIYHSSFITQEAVKLGPISLSLETLTLLSGAISDGSTLVTAVLLAALLGRLRHARRGRVALRGLLAVLGGRLLWSVAVDIILGMVSMGHLSFNTYTGFMEVGAKLVAMAAAVAGTVFLSLLVATLLRETGCSRWIISVAVLHGLLTLVTLFYGLYELPFEEAKLYSVLKNSLETVIAVAGFVFLLLCRAPAGEADLAPLPAESDAAPPRPEDYLFEV